ncbi:2-phosphosulfolactate phosphatase [Albibacterium bauzanense]|uniref:Probable 2-phosphosulfolactate phosphatase n=1 Tax=Albibacterium bauzanense TaxID=653929 RepID=A0A4R1LX63_9SPHI|nr:2-phosphosulfolactate phosphatase [Albibacterium bauzanense]TCK83074.1 2-phosphosulfolactate phosphatase [Albibacterium bauzanense]
MIKELKSRTVSVCLSPAMLPLHTLEGKIAVIIDIFRATSSICYGIHNKAEAIIPVSTIEECLSHKDEDYLLAAERDGRVVEGFDFGNSPFSYTTEKVQGKTIVLTTTNGTRSIRLSMNAKEVVLGSFLNLTALCNWLAKQSESVVLVCAGWKDNFCLEDALFAGAVVEKLQHDFEIHDDGAIASLDLYHCAKGNLNGYLKKSSHRERLKKLHIGKDVEFCLQVDLIDTIPVLRDGKLIKLNEVKSSLNGSQVDLSIDLKSKSI